MVNTEKRQLINADEVSFYSDLFGDLFLFKELSKPEGTLEGGGDPIEGLTEAAYDIAPPGMSCTKLNAGFRQEVPL